MVCLQSSLSLKLRSIVPIARLRGRAGNLFDIPRVVLSMGDPCRAKTLVPDPTGVLRGAQSRPTLDLLQRCS